jgi:hypothetical protein
MASGNDLPQADVGVSMRAAASKQAADVLDALLVAVPGTRYLGDARLRAALRRATEALRAGHDIDAVKAAAGRGYRRP